MLKCTAQLACNECIRTYVGRVFVQEYLLMGWAKVNWFSGRLNMSRAIQELVLLARVEPLAILLTLGTS